jgi:branched-chain amino acid transport system permease protein
VEYLLHILILICIYVTLAVSLDLLVGHTGLLSVAQAAFYGLGAYTSALLAIHHQFPFILSILVGMAVAALCSVLVSLPSLRLHDDYFVIATFGFQMILFSIFNNWRDLTGGQNGIPGIPRPSMWGWTIQSYTGFVGLAGIIATFACVVVWRITTSPFGRVLHAIREDEIFAQALGKNTLRFKVTAFAVSSALAAAAGSLYAHFITYIDSTSFTINESIFIISIVIIGGAGNIWGVIIGAAILVSLPEALRFVELPTSAPASLRQLFVPANLRQIFYASLLIVLLMVRPKGIMGRYGLKSQR